MSSGADTCEVVRLDSNSASPLLIDKGQAQPGSEAMCEAEEQTFYTHTCSVVIVICDFVDLEAMEWVYLLRRKY